MKDSNCVFCKIIDGVIPSEKLYEDQDMVVIRDINPKAKVHLLLLLKSHHKYITELNSEELDTLIRCIRKVSDMSADFGLNNGFRIIINQGDDADQTVPHIHVHFLGGERLQFE